MARQDRLQEVLLSKVNWLADDAEDVREAVLAAGNAILSLPSCTALT